MLNLILVALSISLTAATLFASLNYLPSWNSSANDTYLVVKAGFTTLETAYFAKVKADGGASPAPTAEADGGLAALFSSYYGFLPKAPRGYSWKYGNNGSNDYFCLYSTSGTPVAHEGIWRGMNRVRSVLSDEQYFIVPGDVTVCGAPTPATPQSESTKAPPATYPALLASVYLVKYVPGP